MELTSLLIIAIALVYFAKNTRGKAVIDNIGDAAVELSAAAKSASTALHKQCDELLSDSEAEESKKALKAKIAKAKKSVADTYDDAE